MWVALGAGLNSVSKIMLAFEIEIDGKKCVTAGVENWTLLSLHLTALRNEKASSSEVEGIDCQVQGFTPRDVENPIRHFRWSRLPLKMGSVFTLKIIDTTSVDAPIKFYRSDNKVQENPFTEEEMREMRYKHYLELKKEFESESD